MSENNELYFFLLYLHDAHGLLRALHSHNPGIIISSYSSPLTPSTGSWLLPGMLSCDSIPGYSASDEVIEKAKTLKDGE